MQYQENVATGRQVLTMHPRRTGRPSKVLGQDMLSSHACSPPALSVALPVTRLRAEVCKAGPAGFVFVQGEDCCSLDTRAGEPVFVERDVEQDVARLEMDLEISLFVAREDCGLTRNLADECVQTGSTEMMSEMLSLSALAPGRTACERPSVRNVGATGVVGLPE